MIRKVKTSAKIFESDPVKIQSTVLHTLNKVADIVGSTLGPGGRVCLVESDYPGIPNKITKDGVTVFKALGASNAYSHVLIEAARDAAQRTATEAGDGTTTATILASALVNYIYEYCEANPKMSPQKIARDISKIVRDDLVGYIRSRAIKIGEENKDLVKMVAKVSANGDTDMADAVISAFELIGYSSSAHVTIRESTGPYGYEVGLIEGFPIPMGLEESMGKFFNVFVNDQSNQRCYLEKPVFILYDGVLNDFTTIEALVGEIGRQWQSAESEVKNVVVFANGFSDAVINILAYNFPNPNTINVIPMVTPKAGFINAQTHILNDIAAFTGAKVFGLKDKISEAKISDLGKNMEYFEAYRFRSTVVGSPEELNVQVRVDQLKNQRKAPESIAEGIWLDERIGKLTNGIVKLTIFGGSNGELKEAHDRCEDAICAARNALSNGALPGGCRITIDMALKVLRSEYPEHVKDVLFPSLMAPIQKLLENAGYSEEEVDDRITRLVEEPDMVYDVEKQVFGKAEELGVFDSVGAVEESLKNAVSIATVMGCLGGMVVYPRDAQMEREEAGQDAEFRRIAENPEAYTNEANSRA